MVSSTFHLFSRLPTEIRLKIWDAACFPSQKHHKALHYVKLFDVDDYTANVCQMKHKAQEPDSDQYSNNANPSAYIWDAGLWTACKESREVILRHLQIDDPIKVRMGSQEDSSCLGSSENKGPDDQLGYLYSHDSSQEHKQVVRPSQDIFCIRGNNWESSGELYKFLTMWIPLVTNHWSSLEVFNVAFEFDPSWNANLPKGEFGPSTMIEENSPRGMLAKALYDAAAYNILPQLWIIDKNTLWLKDPDRDIHTVYYDCEDAYVQVAWEDACSDTTRQARWGLAREFIENLSSLGQHDYNSTTSVIARRLGRTACTILMPKSLSQRTLLSFWFVGITR
jgi:hypothetical protein